MPEMKRIASSLANIFPNATVLEVLAILLLNPGREFYQRELVEKTGRAVLQVQRALRRIEAAELLIKSNRGNRAYYTANKQSPVFEDLKGMVLKTVGLGDMLREALIPLQRQIHVAFIFGSFAAGTESPTSDIDLLLVGDVSSRKASGIFGDISRRVNREFNPIVYSVDEFQKKAQEGNRFVHDLITGPKIWLIGSHDDLARIVE
jgi:predicted nucleotidyltransferase